MQIATARRVGVALALVLGVRLSGIPAASAQITNPIKAARDAFNKAKQEEERKWQEDAQRRQQGQTPAPPANQPPT